MASCKADWIAAALDAEDILDAALSVLWITAANRLANLSA